jgi:VanZ family protein
LQEFLRSRLALYGARTIFAVAGIITFVAAVWPPSTAPHLFPWDKAEHFLAFYVLGVCAAVAFPRKSLLFILIGLSAFGAAIELVQALPFVHRDCDVWDWVTDTVAVLMTFAPTLIVPWRAWHSPGSS